MKLPNLSQLESESLMRDQMKAVKGGGGGGSAQPKYDFCLSCVCPDGDDHIELEYQTHMAAYLFTPIPEPDE